MTEHSLQPTEECKLAPECAPSNISSLLSDIQNVLLDAQATAEEMSIKILGEDCRNAPVPNKERGKNVLAHGLGQRCNALYCQAEALRDKLSNILCLL